MFTGNTKVTKVVVTAVTVILVFVNSYRRASQFIVHHGRLQQWAAPFPRALQHRHGVKQGNNWQWWHQRWDRQWQQKLGRKGRRFGLHCSRWGSDPQFWLWWLHFRDTHCLGTGFCNSCHSSGHCSICWHQHCRLPLQKTCLLGTGLDQSRNRPRLQTTQATGTILSYWIK